MIKYGEMIKFGVMIKYGGWASMEGLRQKSVYRIVWWNCKANARDRTTTSIQKQLHNLARFALHCGSFVQLEYSLVHCSIAAQCHFLLPSTFSGKGCSVFLTTVIIMIWKMCSIRVRCYSHRVAGVLHACRGNGLDLYMSYNVGTLPTTQEIKASPWSLIFLNVLHCHCMVTRYTWYTSLGIRIYETAWSLGIHIYGTAWSLGIRIYGTAWSLGICIII